MSSGPTKKRTFDHPEYKLKKKLGTGGMATVYLATQVKLERPVAIKIMAPRMSQNEAFRKRFVREARTLARFNHPNIITIYEVESIDDLWFIVMEYLPGGDLGERMHEPMERNAVLDVVRQVASALAYAHSQNTIHRDIKPENCMFDSNGRLVLTDFGIARAADGDGSETQLTRMGVSVGTPQYMSPEQFETSSVDARADLYSLGVMTYEMLTGGRPFDADSVAAMLFKHASEPIPRLPDDLRDLQPLVDWLMAKKPDDRPSTADEVVSYVNGLLGETPPVVVPPVTRARDVDLEGEKTIVEPSLDEVPVARSPGWLSNRVLIPAGLVLGFLIGVAVYFLMPSEAPQTVAVSTPPTVATEAPAPMAVAPVPPPVDDLADLLIESDDGVVVELTAIDDIEYAFDSLVVLEQSEATDAQKASGWEYFLAVYATRMPSHELVSEATSRVDGWKEIMNYESRFAAGEVEAMDYYYRGYGYQMAHQYDRAIDDYRESLRLEPANTFINEFIDQTRKLQYPDG